MLMASVTKRSCFSFMIFTLASLAIASPTIFTWAPESSNNLSVLTLLKSSELENRPSACDIPFDFVLFSVLITSLSDIVAYAVLLLSRLVLRSACGDFTCTLFTDSLMFDSLSEDSDSLISGEFNFRVSTSSVNSLIVFAFSFFFLPPFCFLPSVFFTGSADCSLERHTSDLWPKREQWVHLPQHSGARCPFSLQLVQILRGTVGLLITGFAENAGVLCSGNASIAVILVISCPTSPSGNSPNNL